MPLYTLHTYYDIKELRKLQQDTEVFPFEFEGTKTLLKSDPCIYIEVTSRILRTIAGARTPSSSHQMIFPDFPSRSAVQVAK